jgi:hypothetical protein
LCYLIAGATKLQVRRLLGVVCDLIAAPTSNLPNDKPADKKSFQPQLRGY